MQVVEQLPTWLTGWPLAMASVAQHARLSKVRTHLVDGV